MEKPRDLTTPGTLIFILVPPRANSAGYRNNLRVSFFSPSVLALCTVPTEQKISRTPGYLPHANKRSRDVEQAQDVRADSVEGKKLSAFLSSFFFQIIKPLYVFPFIVVVAK